MTLTGTTAGSPAAVTVVSGTHTVAVPILLASNLDVSTSGSLSLNGNLNDGGLGKSLNLDGGGTLILSGSDGYSGGTFVNAGTLDVTNVNGLPNGEALTVGAGAGSLFASPVGGGGLLGGMEVAAAGYPLGGQSAVAPAAVPEPGMLALLLAGLAGTAICRGCRRRDHGLARRPERRFVRGTAQRQRRVAVGTGAASLFGSAAADTSEAIANDPRLQPLVRPGFRFWPPFFRFLVERNFNPGHNKRALPFLGAAPLALDLGD